MSSTTSDKTPSTDNKNDAKADDNNADKVVKIGKIVKPEPKATTTKGEPKDHPPKHLAINLTPELRARLDSIAQGEGISSAAVVRRAVMAQLGETDATAATVNRKVEAVQAGLDAALTKLARLDKVIDAALSDTIRVADRLARAAGTDRS